MEERYPDYVYSRRTGEQSMTQATSLVETSKNYGTSCKRRNSEKANSIVIKAKNDGPAETIPLQEIKNNIESDQL